MEIKVDTARLQELFKELSAKVQNTRPAMVAIAETLLESVQENFEVGGRPAWKPLSAARIAQRSKKHEVHGVIHAATWPGKILVEYGAQGGLLGTVSRRATNDTAIVGANAEYAGAMQAERPFLVVQNEDMEDAERILLKHLLK